MDWIGFEIYHLPPNDLLSNSPKHSLNTNILKAVNSWGVSGCVRSSDPGLGGHVLTGSDANIQNQIRRV